MNYNLQNFGNKFKEGIENKRLMKKEVIEGLNVSRTTLDTYLEKGEMPLSIFIKLCELLNLQPSTFFLENKGNINNAMHSPNTTQTISNTDKENELLRQEIKFLREKIEWLETKQKG